MKRITLSNVSHFSAHRISRRLCTVNDPRPFSEIPQPRWSVPYFGTVFHYHLGIFSIPRRADTLQELHRRYGPIVKETLHGNTSVHLFDPDDHQKVYANEGKIPDIVPLLDALVKYREEKDIAPGVGNVNGENWYRVRRAVRDLMMRPLAVADFLDREQEVVDEFVHRLWTIRNPANGLISDMEQEISKWNYETAGYNVFDKRFHCLDSGPEDPPLRMIAINAEFFEKSTKLYFSVLPLYKYFQTPLWRKLVAEENEFYGHGIKHFNSAVEECMKVMENDKENDNDDDRFLFLKHLLRKPEMTMKDTHVICHSLFVDGFSTTVPSTIGLLYCVASNPEKQEILYKEICDVIGPENDHITFQHLNHMTYLRACVKEAFRFFPIGLDVSRILGKDMVLSGYNVPANTPVNLNTTAVLQNEKYFKDAASYIPERWLRGGSASDVHPYANIPFSHGPRQCLGRRFAEQEMYLLLSKLIQRYRIEWHGTQPLRQRWRILNIPDGPAKIAIYRRRE